MAMARAFSCLNVMSKIYEKVEFSSGLFLVAIFDDDVCQETVARGAEGKDPETNLNHIGGI